MTSSPAAQQATTPAPARDRYGERSPSRRGIVVLGVVCGVLAAVGLGWVAWGMLQPSAAGEVGTYEAVDDAHVDLLLEVTRPVGSVAVCTVEALSSGFGQVGIVDVTIEPSESRVSRIDVTMATSERASYVSVKSCRLE